MSENDKKELQALWRYVINLIALIIVVSYMLNFILHAKTGQVVPESIDYLVPLGALLVLKVGS